MSGTATATESDTSIKAFLFKRLVPLARGDHDQVGLHPRRSYSEYQFHWLPIASSEIDEAARHFPIVLADTQIPMLAVVVGLHRGQSLFIDRRGNWTGGYLPLYLRQMPFHIVRVRSGNAPAQPAVCVDLDSPLVDKNEPCKIIEGGGIGASAQDAIEAAKEFERGALASVAFAQALERSGLAVHVAALPQAADCLSLRSLKAVSPARLRDASPQRLAPFVSAGVRPLLVACAQSIEHFDALRQIQEQCYAEQEAHLRADL